MHPKYIPNTSQIHPKYIPNDIPNTSQMHPKLLCLENIGKTKIFVSLETSQNHFQNFGDDFGDDIGQQVGQTFGASCGQTLFSIWGITCIIRREKKTWSSAEFLLGSPSQSQAPMHQASAASSQPTSQPIYQPASQGASPALPTGWGCFLGAVWQSASAKGYLTRGYPTKWFARSYLTKRVC